MHVDTRLDTHTCPLHTVYQAKIDTWHYKFNDNTYVTTLLSVTRQSARNTLCNMPCIGSVWWRPRTGPARRELPLSGQCVAAVAAEQM